MVPLVVASAVSIAGVTSSFGGGSSSSMSRGSSSSSYGHSGGGRGGFGIGGGVGLGLSIGSGISESSRSPPPEAKPHSRAKVQEKTSVAPKDECPPKEEDKPCRQYPDSNDVDQVAPPKSDPVDAADECNFLAGHVAGLAELAKDQGWQIIVRCNKRAALKWYRDKSVQPKPASVDKKTDGCGIARDEDGKRYHSDIDLFLVLRKGPNGLERENIDPADSPAFIKTANGYLRKHTGIDKEWIRHADQTSLMYTGFKWDRDNKPVPDPDKPLFGRMEPGKFERFLVAEANGKIRIICGAENLKRYNDLQKRESPTTVATNSSQPPSNSSSGSRSVSGASQGSGLSGIPVYVSKLDLVAKLLCPQGFKQKDTFYGGTRCAPTLAAMDSTPIQGTGLKAIFPPEDYPWVADPNESTLAKCIAAISLRLPGVGGPKCIAAHKKLYNNLQDALKNQNPKMTLRDTVEDQWSEFTKEIESKDMLDPGGYDPCWLASTLDRDVGACLNHTYSRWELSQH